MSYHDYQTSTELDEGIERAAIWLDGNMPGWADQIDVHGLNMDSSLMCVAGQLTNGQDDPYDGEGWWHLMNKVSIDLGSKYVDGTFSDREGEETWEREIAARRTDA